MKNQRLNFTPNTPFIIMICSDKFRFGSPSWTRITYHTYSDFE